MPQRLYASLLYGARYEHAPCRSRSTRNTAIPLGNQRRRDRQLQRAPPATTGGCGKGGTSLRRIAPNFEYSPNTVLRARVRECVGLVFPTLGANQKTSSGEVPINHRLPIAVVVRHRPAGSNRVYRTGMVGESHRPARMTPGISHPDAIKSWAIPTLGEWAENPSPNPACQWRRDSVPFWRRSSGKMSTSIHRGQS